MEVSQLTLADAILNGIEAYGADLKSKYVKIDLLEILARVEKQLPNMLNQDIWKSVYVDYHEPFVERLWTTFGDCRIYLHRIHPSSSLSENKELFHPHAWPSAMKILKGGYKMGIGFGEGQYIPEIAATVVLPPGSSYEMTDPNVWHYVQPSNEPSLSIMITGMPWKRWAPKSTKPLRELTFAEKTGLIYDFKKIYGEEDGTLE